MDKHTIEGFMPDDIYRQLKEGTGNVLPHIPIYHGSPNKICKPQFGFGEDKHDYGKGFYTTLDFELACEWAVCTSNGANGYVHKYLLDMRELSFLMINEKYGVLTWLATLAKHRSAANSKKYKLNEEKLIDKYYKKEIEEYDIIIGYRADDSFFKFAKQAIRGEVDISLLEDIMHQGKLGYQIFIQSKKAFSKIVEIEQCEAGYYREVDYQKYSEEYNNRDGSARDYVTELIESDKNTLQDTIENYL